MVFLADRIRGRRGVTSHLEEQSVATPSLTALEEFDLVPVRVIDKGHFPSTQECFPPAIRPNLNTLLLKLVAKSNQIGHSKREVHEIFGYRQFVLR